MTIALSLSYTSTQNPDTESSWIESDYLTIYVYRARDKQGELRRGGGGVTFQMANFWIKLLLRDQLVIIWVSYWDDIYSCFSLLPPPPQPKYTLPDLNMALGLRPLIWVNTTYLLVEAVDVAGFLLDYLNVRFQNILELQDVVEGGLEWWFVVQRTVVLGRSQRVRHVLPSGTLCLGLGFVTLSVCCRLLGLIPFYHFR